MKQVWYIATHVHTSVCMNVGTCVCVAFVLLCVGAMYPRVRYDMIYDVCENACMRHIPPFIKVNSFVIYCYVV